MCGIVAFSGVESFNKQNIDTLMYINSIERGSDATGIYSNLNDLQKDIIAGWEYVTNKIDIIPDTMFMGHVRSKTIGLNSIANAHPFKRDNCILIHNGTLTNHWDLLRKYELDYKDFSVDSDVIAGCLNKTNDFSVLSEINGAAALVFHDIRIKNRLYVFKNKERPLFRGHIGPNMYISSIEESLKLIQCINIKEFENDKLYTIEDGLFVKDPIDITSNPYKHNYGTTVHHVTGNTDMYEIKKLIGCNVRMKYHGEIKSGNIVTRKYNKHDYCRIIGIVNENTFTILIGKSIIPVTVNKSMLIMSDVLRTDDYVICLVDLAFSGRPLSDSTLVRIPEYEKGLIIKVNNTFSDGTFSAHVNGRFDNNISKQHFRKLYPGDKTLRKYLGKLNNVTEADVVPDLSLEEYLSGRPDYTRPPFNVDENINTAIQTQTPIGFPSTLEQSPLNILGNNNSFLDEGKRKLEGSVQFIEDSLTHFFVSADRLIESAVKHFESVEYEEAAQKIVSLEKLNHNLYETLFTPEDAPTRK